MSTPSSIRCRDSNPWSLERESPPITTRPGLPPYRNFIISARQRNHPLRNLQTGASSVNESLGMHVAYKTRNLSLLKSVTPAAKIWWEKVFSVGKSWGKERDRGPKLLPKRLWTFVGFAKRNIFGFKEIEKRNFFSWPTWQRLRGTSCGRLGRVGSMLLAALGSIPREKVYVYFWHFKMCKLLSIMTHTV